MTTSTWKSQPVSGEWNTPDNWSPAGEPMQTAAFADSSQTAIGFDPAGGAKVERVEFAGNAPAYTFSFGPGTAPGLTISGEGVANGSGNRQSFIVAATTKGYSEPQLQFTGSASAGGDNVYYCAGPENEQGYGGGVICFHDKATAGSAEFKVWTGAGIPPKQNSTVGGEVAFCDNATAERARFIIYGSLGSDGDTFGNVVFHDNATAASASFTNVGGTVSGGDGGNTQFYGTTTAATAIFNNWGGTHSKANGGDVAFDASANGGNGCFHNYAAKAEGAYGGVTSFNNNWPYVNDAPGASAGHGAYFNYGARDGELGGGGHTSFSARYGSPTGADATIVNYGSVLESKSSAGHTIFSINLPSDYFPTAGNAVIYNHPAASGQGAAGFTEFSVYGSGSDKGVPTAGNATIINLGAWMAEAAGGYTVFSGSSSAGNATLIACGGSHGGDGGKIAFYDDASGGTANVKLWGNGTLDIGDHSGGVGIGSLELNGGIIAVQLGSQPTALAVAGTLSLNAPQARFAFWQKDGGGFAFNTAYTILTGAGLSGFTAERFCGNSIDGVEPSFAIVGNALQVSFEQA